VKLYETLEWRTWDNTESVTWRSNRNSGNLTDTILDVVKRRSINFKEIAASGGAYVGGDVVFLIPAPFVINGPPKPGDDLFDLDENKYKVLSVTGQRRDATGYQTWKCTCRNLAIAHDLADIGFEIQTPVMNLDQTGVEFRTWKVLYSGIKAKVQKLSEATADVFNIRGFKGTYAVYVEQEVTVSNKDRVTWSGAPAGYLEIVGYHPAASLDQLPIIDCEAVP